MFGNAYQTYYLTEEDQYELSGDYEMSPDSVDYYVEGYWNPMSEDSIFRMQSYWIGIAAGTLFGYMLLPRILKKVRG